MSAHPIPFNGTMVRAILEGRKTQTRRPFKPRFVRMMQAAVRLGECSDFLGEGTLGEYDESYIRQFSPYGQPGDILWVRETWQTTRALNDTAPRNLVPGAPIQYVADGWNPGFGLPDAGKKRPPMFMPRWAARINLRVKSVRVQRVQDITERDAWKEGCEKGERADNGSYFPKNIPILNKRGERVCEQGFEDAREWFAWSWNQIYGEDNFDEANPWVWAIEFERIEERAEQ